MIANAYLNEWRQTVPWSDNKMVEQDLIISRLLVELFNHPKISNSLSFRGGTAIYKLFASHPVRYSENIDLVQIKAEPIGETIAAIRSIVDPILGKPESCIVIDVSHNTHEKYSVTRDDIHDFENKYGTISKDTFVIVHTGWERFWNQPEKYRNNLIFPSVSKEAAQLLLERNIIGLGIDTLSPDREEDGFPVHQLLLNAGKYIIENVANCNKLPSIGASIIALPIKIKDGTEAPIRLIGIKYKNENH